MPTQTKKTTSKSKSAKKTAPTKRPIRREIGALFCLLFAVLLFFGYVENVGSWIAVPRNALKWLFGAGFYVVPFALVLSAVTLAFHRGHPVVLRVTCTMLFPVILSVIIQAFGGNGGHFTGTIADAISTATHPAFTVVLFLVFALVLLFFVFNRLILRSAQMYMNRERREYEPQPEPELPQLPAIMARPPREPRERRRRPKKGEFDIPLDGDTPLPPKEHITPHTPVDAEATALPETSTEEPRRRIRPENDIPLDIPFMEDRPRRAPESVAETELVSDKPPRRRTSAEPVVPPLDIPAEEKKTPRKSAASSESQQSGDYKFPPIELLGLGDGKTSNEGFDEVQKNIERLESAFHSFGVNVKISNATRGPSVTRYEAELEAGVKLARLTNLADDIALSLGATGVRIGAMPGVMSTVGIEVPNRSVSTVFLREIIDSPPFQKAASKIAFAIGKNISGDCIVGDISKLTHLLVAGTTGSGKSVCLNSLILSILYKATPEEVRFIMIDPKLVEFRIFNGIPHLLVPVVTDVKKASGALQWAVVEMEKRYRMLAEENVRDLAGYNKAMREKGEETLPQIVVIIDELADLMMTCGKEVEESIVRVAQKGRAAGMHLVIATQSPRADVITGLMKANIPSRIALKVSSALESRIILDAGGGADRLIGNGDMLFAPIGSSKPVRLQGTWVTDDEREEIVKFIKTSGETQYSDEIMTEIERAAEARDKANNKPEPTLESDYDEMLPAAAEVIFEMNQASTSLLQRRLKLGYARAARIVDQLEEVGVLGPFEGSKPRQILITRDQWREMQLVQGTAPLDNSAPSGYSSSASQDELADEGDETDTAPF